MIVLSPVPGTEQILISAHPCLASWIVEISRLSSQSMTRQSQSLFFHSAIRCYPVYAKTLTLKSRRQGKHTWEIKANVTQRRCITNHSCVVLGGEGLRSGCGDGPAGINVGGVRAGGQVSRPSIRCCLLLIENKGKGKCYFRSSCQDRWLKWSWGNLLKFFLTDDTSPRSRNGWATPRFSGSALHSFQGLHIASACLSLGMPRMEVEKVGFRRLWQVDPMARPPLMATCTHVSGVWLLPQVLCRNHQPSGYSLSEATVGPQRTFESMDRILESTEMYEAQNSLSYPQ